jgi:3-phenylpropionate/cinnamic acid dioxygenase small subunit
MAEPLAVLVDERAIAGILHDYARALDTRDWDLLAALFTADAVVDYSGEGGPVCQGPAAVVADCQADFAGLDATHHLIGNVAVDVAGDEARATCALQAWHYRSGAAGGSTLLLAGGYEDRLVRTPAGWRIAHRVLRVAFEDGNPEVKAPRE